MIRKINESNQELNESLETRKIIQATNNLLQYDYSSELIDIEREVRKLVDDRRLSNKIEKQLSDIASEYIRAKRNAERELRDILIKVNDHLGIE